MARKKKEEQVIETKVEVTKTNENNENEVTKTNEKVVNKEEEPQKPTKDNENEQQKVIKGVVTAKGGLRIREEQSLESNIIDVVSYNKEIDILEELEEWVRVEQGYMLKKFVQINK